VIPDEVFVETILNFLAPVRRYLDDPSITEIMINGPDAVYVEKGGRIERIDARFPSNEALMATLRNIAQFTGKQVDEHHPILEARLPDGSRVQAIVPPASFGGATVAIRRFSRSLYAMERLIELGALSAEAASALAAFVVAKLNIMVAGGTGSGKTSLLNTLSRYVPDYERIVVIEETKEVQLQQEHVVYLEARLPDAKGRGGASIRDLFRATLRLRPDRIVIGEIRGGEALDIIQAMVSGHGGCMGTLHATYPRDTLTRLETMALMSDVEVPLAALRLQIASGINLVVQVGRFPDGTRKITHVTEVCGFDLATSKYDLRDVFSREFRGLDAKGQAVTELVPTGYVPRCVPQLREHGVDLPELVYEMARRCENGSHQPGRPHEPDATTFAP
jgi:pilus assembly protein CpaF